MHYTHLHNLHPDSHILVCGRGPSIVEAHKFTARADKIICCSDADPLCQPSYRIIIDDPEPYIAQNRYDTIANKYLPYIVSHNPKWEALIPQHQFIKYPLTGYHRQPYLDLYKNLFGSYTVAFTAVCLAFVLGASHIALIGIDLNIPPFTQRLPLINRHFSDLAAFLHSRQISIVNLSKDSLLTSVPKLQ